MITAAEIEAVARAACRSLGMSPDTTIKCSDGVWRAKWQIIEEAMNRAIEAVKGAGE